MFEAYIDRGSQARATWRRRFSGHAIAVVVHAVVLIAAVRLASRTHPVPAAVTTPTVVVRVAPLYWPRPKVEPAPVVIAPEPPQSPRAARPGPRPPRRGRTAIAAAPSQQTPTPAVAAVEADAPDGAPSLLPDQGASTAMAGPVLVTQPAPPPPRLAAPRFLPEPLANQQKLAGGPPDFPAILAVNGALYVIHARICVAATGDVDRVELLKTAHPTLDANVSSAVAKWRYRPLLAGTIPVPFCTLARFEFRTT